MNGRQFGIELEISNISIRQSYEAIKAIGVKVEIESYNHTDHEDHWKIVRDGSVRDGHEVVSPILVGQQGLDESIRVADALSAAGASANRTCGFHVHFDANSMSAAEVRTICTRYAKFEDQIYAFMPKSRRATATTRSTFRLTSATTPSNSASTAERWIPARSTTGSSSSTTL